MVQIQDTNGDGQARFSVNINIILTGSKKMTHEEQAQLMPVQAVRILIVDAETPATILVDEVVDVKRFSTGSVGYGLQQRSVEFRDDDGE